MKSCKSYIFSLYPVGECENNACLAFMMSSHRISARLILYTRFKIQGKQLENVQQQQFQFKPTIEILPKTTSAHFWS